MSSYLNAQAVSLLNMKTLAERLRAALEASGMNQSELARRVGVTRGAVSLWLTGQTGSLDGQNLVKVAIALNVSPVWLQTGRGKMKPSAAGTLSFEGNPEYPTIPRVMIKISEDQASYEMSERDADGPVVFARSWYEWRAYKPEKLFAMAVADSGMEPGLYLEDWVVVNTEDTTPQDGHVFLLSLEGDAVIKRLFKSEGRWIAASDNPDKRIHRDRPLGEGSFIIGRVVHKQSEKI
jgi:phage repressor protein C with HTH and peptisase S24 domain